MWTQAWINWGLPLAAIAFAAIGYLFVSHKTHQFDRKYGAPHK